MKPPRQPPVDPVLKILVLMAVFAGACVVWDTAYPNGMDRGEGPIPGELIRHIMWLALSALVFLGISAQPIERVRKLSFLFYGIALSACLLVLIPGVGRSAHGAQRWFGIGSLSLQPAEILKSATILFLSACYALNLPPFRRRTRNWIHWLDHRFVPTIARAFPLLAVLVSFVLVEREPDLGTAMVVVATAFGLLILGLGKKLFGIYDRTVLVGILVIACAGAGYLAVSKGYRLERLLTHARRWDQAVVDGPGYQAAQAELAMAVGGPAGVGIGQGRAKHVLPAATTDFSFVTIAEEFGILGSAAVLLLLGGISLRLLWLSSFVADPFRCLVVAGTGWLIGVQSVGNLLVAGAAVPAVGIPLPFFSYGGSSLLALAVALGACSSALADSGLPEEADEARRDRRRYGRPRLSRA